MRPSSLPSPGGSHRRRRAAVPLATLITASEPPRADASPNPPNPTLCKGVKRFFVVHGGLFSRDDVTLDDVRAIPRMKLKQPGQEGLMCEMLWCVDTLSRLSCSARLGH